MASEDGNTVARGAVPYPDGLVIGRRELICRVDMSGHEPSGCGALTIQGIS